MPAPQSRLPGLEQELRQLVATKPEQVRAALARTFPGRLPEAARALAARPQRELRLIAAEIERAFTRLVEPHWQRVRSLLDADIVHRARTLADAGAATMFEHLHTSARWHGDHLLLTDAAGIDGDPQEVTIGSGGLVLEPSVFIWPDLYVKRWTVTRTTIRYPGRGVGVLWDPVRGPVPNGLAELLGERRAQILALLRAPTRRPSSPSASRSRPAPYHSTSRRCAPPDSSAASDSAVSACTWRPRSVPSLLRPVSAMTGSSPGLAAGVGQLGLRFSFTGRDQPRRG